MEITELAGCENQEILLNPLYVFEETGEDGEGNVIGELRKKGDLIYGHKLKTAGLS